MSDAGITELTRGIEPYRRGNTGIDFVHVIESGRPGPHAMIMGLTHGNEPCGMWAVTRLLDLGFRPARGRLSLGLGNIAAYAYLQAGLESQTRFLHRDLNRLWRDDWIDGDGESIEARRARELRPHLRTVDVLLDLHSTASVPRPFFVLAELPKTRALADAMAWPATQQLMPGGCPEGRHLVDYGRFSDPADPASALSVECGRHSDPASGEVAWRAALRFLVVLGMLSAEQADRLGTPAPSPAIERYRVIQPCIARTDRFRLTVPDSGFVAVPRGAEVARDGDQPVLAPFLTASSWPHAQPGVRARSPSTGACGWHEGRARDHPRARFRRARQCASQGRRLGPRCPPASKRTSVLLGKPAKGS